MNDSRTAYRRLSLILDEGSLMELGESVAARSADFSSQGSSPSDGVITGFGTINSRPVYIYSQNGDVLGGSVGEMHAEKLLRLYSMALKTHTPVIGLVDSTGLRLGEGVDSLSAFGRLYKAQTEAKGIIPQLCLVFGGCGGGMAFSAAMADFVFTEDGGAAVYINAAAAREYKGSRTNMDKVLSDNPAGAAMAQYTGSEDEICAFARELYDYLPLSHEDTAPELECEDDINRDCQGLSLHAEPREIAKEMSDGGQCLELSAGKADGSFTGFMKLNGKTIGVAASGAGGRISSECMEKLADFIDFCSAFDIPLLTLTDAEGFSTESGQEAMLPRSGAYLLSVLSGATAIPRVNLITGSAVGTAFTLMNSKSVGADFVFAWKGADVKVMDELSAAHILYEDEIAKAEDKKGTAYHKAEEYLEKAGLNAFLRRGHIDKLIEPAASRRYVIGAFEMLMAKEAY